MVGEPSLTYALSWRMAVARDALVAGHKNVEQVAAATGYGSASAFSIAFSRTVGVSPSRYAREGLNAACSHRDPLAVSDQIRRRSGAG